jgi:hypothetical protein
MKHSNSSEQGTRPPGDENPPVIGVTVEQFATMIGMSERSAWTVIKQEAEKAKREGRANALPVLKPIDGGQIRRLRVSDVTRWWNGLS